MLINTSITPQAFTPLLASRDSNSPASSAADEVSITSEFHAAFQQALARADEQAPTLADNLRRMVAEAPDAVPLYLANVTAQNQRDLNAAAAKLAAMEFGDYEERRSKSPLDSFKRVLDSTNARNVEDNQAYLAKYTEFMVALSHLMATLNSHIKAGDEGKSNIDSPGLYDQLREFCKDWSGAKGTLGTFSTRAEADAAAQRFRGKTVEVFQNGDKFDVRFSFSKLTPIVVSLSPGPIADNRLLQTAIESMNKGEVPAKAADLARARGARTDAHIEEWFKETFKRDGINAHGVQSISLAMNDVQKTHQTDLDLLLNDFSRATSQFDNLVKLYSSLVTMMTETCKSFL